MSNNNLTFVGRNFTAQKKSRFEPYVKQPRGCPQVRQVDHLLYFTEVTDYLFETNNNLGDTNVIIYVRTSGY